MERWDVYDRDRRKTGRTMVRGEPCGQEDYHLVVQVWIRGSDGRWLISRRSPEKNLPLMWEPTGGSALAGEDSLAAALREVREELGVTLDPRRGRLFASCRRDRPQWRYPGFKDIWVFGHDCPLSEVTLQPGETCDARWATADEIAELTAQQQFVPMHASEQALLGLAQWETDDAATRHVRPACAEDLARIAEIEVFNYRLYFYPIFRSDEFYFGDMQVASRARSYEQETEKLFVYDDGVVKGFVLVDDREIRRLYVEPVLQGRRIGAALLEYALRAFGANRLWALERNPRAIAFYRRHGFRVTGERRPEEGTSEYLVRLER